MVSRLELPGLSTVATRQLGGRVSIPINAVDGQRLPRYESQPFGREDA